MRVLFREGYVEEVVSAATTYVRDEENNIIGFGIEFVFSQFQNHDDVEPILYVYDDSISIDEAEERANKLIKELLVSGYVDFSKESIDMSI